jgi:hypothetical protein
VHARCATLAIERQGEGVALLLGRESDDQRRSGGMATRRVAAAENF